MAADTIPSRLIKQAARRGNADAYYVKSGRSWVPTSWKDYEAQVRQAGKALIALGFEPGQTVSILGFNRPEWVIFDIACMSAGGAPAGIYTTCSPPEVQYIIDHAESPYVLLENEDQWKKVQAERDKLPKLKHVIMMKGAPKIDDDLVMSWDTFMAKGDDVDDATYEARIDNLKEDQLATFIYTSGTTGPPKGVMLSHKNLAWTAQCSLDITSMSHEDCSLSYLPLSHIAEQMFSIHAPITVGSAVYFAESIADVPENLKEVQPTVFFGVPRIWEKFHSGITGKLKDASPTKRKLVDWAMGVGREVTDQRNSSKPVGGFLGLKYKIADKLIFSKLKPAVGLGRAKICVSGAAPIAKEVLEFFAGLTITVHEVYGQSEDCGPTTFNLPGNTQYGTVGTALKGVEVKLTDEDEIIVKGPNVFLGYFKDQEATDATLKDGWLYSGDLGKFDSDGFLTITGRKKEIIITAGGKNIAPKNIEAAIKNIEIVAQAVVIGDRRKYLSALVTLDPEAVERFASDNNIASESLHTEEAIIAAVQAGIDKTVNPQFARVEQIKKFKLLPRDLTVEDGELTPTLKIKRRIVNDNWGEVIESMYTD